MKGDSRIRVGIVGCGAVTEHFHLPAAAKLEGLEIVALVDKDFARAEGLARKYRIERVAQDYGRIMDEIDAAIIALPHRLHAPVAIELLARHKHVLIEKPMAVSREECEALIRTSQQVEAVLAVGLMRRFLQSARWTKKILEAGLLGRINSFDVREGSISSWPMASDFSLRREAAGGGVLINNGSHTLDLILW